MKMITAPQLKFAKALAAERGQDAAGFERLTCREASQLIDRLKRTPRLERATAPAPAAAVELTGTYTAVFADGSRTTIRVAAEKWCDGKVVASVMTGPDNEWSFTGVGFLGGDLQVRTWSRLQGTPLERRLLAALEVVKANTVSAKEAFLAEADAYALRSGRCIRCAHKLTVPRSLFRGMGPVCAKAEGL